jgi:transcriptional regulator with XRE-family HTH domain
MKIHGTENNLYILKEFGKRIQDVRISMRITQKELAERSGVSASTMERIEKGENVKIENILNVLRALSLLANFDVLVPEQEIVPTIVIERRVKRQRVRHKKANEDKIEIEWKRGDES